MKTKQRTRGFVGAIVSACTFALLPLFSVPVMNAGMETPSVLIYRFIFGSIFILAGMIYMRVDLKISLCDLWRLVILAVLNDVTALTQFYSFKFIDSGAAITIFSVYPVFTCLIMVLFFHEKLTLRTAVAIVLAVVGVGAVSGINLGGGSDVALLNGITLALGAGLSYSLYMVLVPVLRVGSMNSLKLTFYVFVLGLGFLLIFTPFTPAGIQPVGSWKVGATLLLLGLVPTAISNFTLIVGLRNIGSTLTSILGDLEPPVAMTVGVLVLGESVTAVQVAGLVLIVLAVSIIILKKNGDTAPAPAD